MKKKTVAWAIIFIGAIIIVSGAFLCQNICIPGPCTQMYSNDCLLKVLTIGVLILIIGAALKKAA